MKRGNFTHRILVLVALTVLVTGISGCYASRFVEDNMIPEHTALQPVAAPVFFPAFWAASAVDVALSPVYAFGNEKDGRHIPNYWDYTLQNSWAQGAPAHRGLGE